MNRQRNRRMEPEAYVNGILQANRIILSQAITVSESTRPDDRTLTHQILSQLLPHTGTSFRIGITGIPGVGKSTFINALGTYLTSLDLHVAVLAVDPSSQISQGSILGDKTRMHDLARNPLAYIRPSPTAGSLGGITRRSREALLLCEAAGFDVILIETVGVGQSEIAVHDMVDAFLLLAIPHAGDEVQGIKRGIMEMVDFIFINKAEDDLLPLARTTKIHFSHALRLMSSHASGWKPEILLGSALKQEGIVQLWEQLLTYRKQIEENGFLAQNREQQSLIWMKAHIMAELEASFFGQLGIQDRLTQMEDAILQKQISPLEAAEHLLQLWRGEDSSLS